MHMRSCSVSAHQWLWERNVTGLTVVNKFAQQKSIRWHIVGRKLTADACMMGDMNKVALRSMQINTSMLYWPRGDITHKRQIVVHPT